ncbi:MAG: hypothetical protein QM741_00555 [Rudaea sp.]|uniref:hypothetical protein n=1 Tax=Rudaea sp. TaxID=2136325 RepID=UPI0039E371C0
MSKTGVLKIGLAIALALAVAAGASPQKTRRSQAPPQQTEQDDDAPTPQSRQAADADDDMPSTQADASDDDSSARDEPADTPPARSNRSPPQRPLPRDPFRGDWNVSADDGTAFAVNFHPAKKDLAKKLLGKLAGGQKDDKIAATVTPPVLKIVNGSAVGKLYLHLSISVSGQQGDIMLTLAPDGRSFTGAGQLADGTELAWTGRQASSGARSAQARASDLLRGQGSRQRKQAATEQDDDSEDP